MFLFISDLRRIEHSTECSAFTPVSGNLVQLSSLLPLSSPFTIANPLHVKRFAGAIGQRATTDKLDAQLIAHHSEAIKPPLSELGYINNKQARALIDVAPVNRESGRYKGKRKIQGGRPQVRTVLYMAMMSAMQSNPYF